MQIIKKLIKDLKINELNPRKKLSSSSHAYKSIKKSIQKFDYVDPIIWNINTETVVGGHQRLEVLKDLGYEEVEVSVVDLSKKDERLLNLALNKIKGSWDLIKLEEVFKELGDIDDLDATGFLESELKQLGKYVEEAKDSATNELGNLEYQIVVICNDELHQSQLLESFNEQGLKCRPLIL